MRTKRSVSAPAPYYALKADAEFSLHSAIEAQLKKLKLVCRQLREQFTMLDLEARVVERLYYKNKNQHRSATFWHRFVEMRRYTGRLNGLGLPDVLDDLRASFYGPIAQRKYVHCYWV
jgi:hypothetical protein